MKIKTIGQIFFTSVLLWTTQASAAWYEVTGRSAVVATQQQARLHALEDAI